VEPGLKWNPVKELKEEPREECSSRLMAWNPVKELKDPIPDRIPPHFQSPVESGEGIERFNNANARIGVGDGSGIR